MAVALVSRLSSSAGRYAYSGAGNCDDGDEAEVAIAAALATTR